MQSEHILSGHQAASPLLSAALSCPKKKEKKKASIPFLLSCNWGEMLLVTHFFFLKIEIKEDDFVRSKAGPQKEKYCSLCVGPNMKEVRLTDHIVSKSWKALYYFMKDAKKKKNPPAGRVAIRQHNLRNIGFLVLQSWMFAPCNHKVGE